MINEQEIKKYLAQIKDPSQPGRGSILEAVEELRVEKDRIHLSLVTTSADEKVREAMKQRIREVLGKVKGVTGINLNLVTRSPAQERANLLRKESEQAVRELPIHFIIPVASGKGGVGKSTVSVNLAVALKERGWRVGLMDADVYGPSVPMLMGVSGSPRQENGKIVPHERYGVKMISMGFFLPKGEAVIWRGPMLHKAVDQFLGTVDWGELDFLIVDLPPGTGDVQLSLCQKIPLTGAVIVSTPQDLAFSVAEKAILMFQKLRTPVLGLIENMSGHVCAHCGHLEAIFGSGGAEKYGKIHDIPVLAAIPLETEVRKNSDAGNPVVLARPESASAKAFQEAAGRLERIVEQRADARANGENGGPVEISRPSPDRVYMRWPDGSEYTHDAFSLRLACPCASCVDETSGVRMLKPESIRKDIHPTAIEPVGRYGILFRWSDGHATGIYTFEYLHELQSASAKTPV